MMKIFTRNYYLNTNKNSYYRSIFLFLMFLFTSNFKIEAQVTYTSTSTNSWSTQVWSPVGTPGASDNVIINHNITANVAVNINNLTINAGRTLTVAGLNFTVNGTSTLNGIFTDNNTTGNNLFVGLVTVNNGGQLTNVNTITHSFEFRNGLTTAGNGTINLQNLGTATFSTNNQTILAPANTTVSPSFVNINILGDIDLTNNSLLAAGLTIRGNLTGTTAGSTFINASNSFTNYQGAQAPMAASGTISLTAAGNTFNYTGTTQTVATAVYHHLGFTTAGTKTINDITVNGNFTRTNGTLTFTGVQTFAGTTAANYNVNTALTFTEVVVNKPGSTLTLTNTGFNTGLLTVSSGTLAFGATTARTITLTDNLAGSGCINMSGAAHILNLGGASNQLSTLTTDANNSIVQYSRSGDQSIFGSINYKVLTLSGAGTKTINGQVRVDNTLNMSASGTYFLDINNNDLKLSAVANLNGTFSATRYIITSGDGNLIKEGTTVAQLRTNMATNGLYPVGSGGFYTPYQITALTGNISGTAQISIRAIPSRQSNVDYFYNSLNKYWDIQTANIAVTSANFQFSFNASEVIGSVAAYVPRVWNGTTLSGVSTPSAPGSNPITISNNTFLWGQWTATDPTVRAALYSYQSGDWGTANTWTTDPSGNTLISPMVPSSQDQVVILNGRTVSATSAQSVASLTINAGGVLDLGTSTGHSFGPISGEGRMLLSSTNLPTGTYTNFVSSTGGTIVYNNIGATALTLPTTQTTYNNLEILNTSATANTLVLNSNLTVNGNFSVSKTSTGTLTFKVGGDATNRSLLFNKNVTIGSGCSWNAGIFNAIHSVTIAGNLINSGSIDFTNGADWASTTNGAINIFFTGPNQNTTLTCNAGSSTTFFGFQSTKSTSYELSVLAATGVYLNFVNNGNTFEANGNGILRFGNNITIPRMNGSGGGNYDIGSPAALPVVWIDGATLTYNGGGAIVPYGTLKITAGSLTCQSGQGGIVIRESGLILVEGGIINAKMIRTSVTAATHRGTYIQTGGTVTLTGDNGSEQGHYAVFSLPYNENVFKMEGGILNITRANTTGSFCPNGGIMIGSLPQNIDVIGGTVNISLAGAINFDISSRAPFWNLNINKTSAGAGAVRITPITWSFSGSNANQATLPAFPLLVLNDFTIIGGSNSGALNANSFDVTIGGNFNLQSGTTYTSGVNNLTFNGVNNQTFTVSGSLSTGLNILTINKSNSSILTIAGSASTIIADGGISILNGTLADGGKILSTKGNLSNSGTHTGTGKILMNGTASAQIISGNGLGIFQNLELANTYGTAGSNQISLNNDITVNGTINISTDRILYISDHQLRLNQSATFSGTFGVNRFVKTNGNLSDGGISKTYASTATSFIYPFGSGTNYTPATIQFSSAPTTYGTLDVRPVATKHIYATNTDCFSQYWKVNQTGFTGVPTNGMNMTFNYGTISDNTNYVPAFYNYTTNQYTVLNNTAFVNETSNIISFSGISNLAGDYTAGISAAFGTVTPYYSRANGNWNIPSTWSNTGHNGVPSLTIPTSSSPVLIGDGNMFNHTITVTSNNTIAGSLIIAAGSALDIAATTGNNFGALPYSTAGGSGTMRISSNSSTAEFPAGDFGLFFKENGGITEYYTVSNSFTLPTQTAAPTNLSINSYRNLNLIAAGTNKITLPNSDVLIYEHLNVSSVNSNSEVLLNDISSKTLTINGDLNVNNGILRFENLYPQTVNLLGNLTIGNSATFDVRNTANRLHFLTVSGNITNNGILDFRANSNVRLTLTGNQNITISGINPSATSDFFNIIVDKGIDQSFVAEVTIPGTFSSTGDNWLQLLNGTFKYSRPGTITLTSGNNIEYTIPSSAKLSVNHTSAEVGIGQNNSNEADLIIGGTLEILNGTVNVGAAAYTSHNDIEYTPTDFPTIDVRNNGVLNVNGQIRRSCFSLQGGLRYYQSENSTVLVRGKNPETAGSFNFDRAKFEILNENSVFNMSGNSLLIIDRNGLASTMFGDIYISPASYNITGGEVRVGTANTSASSVFNLTTNAPFWNFTLDGTTSPKTLNNLISETTILNNFTIDGNSIFNTNGFDINIGGNFTNRNTNNAIGLNVGGYRTILNTQTTRFNGSSSNQSITGVSGNITNFSNLVLNNTFLNGTITSETNSNIQVIGNADLISGNLNIGANNFNLYGHLNNNVSITGTTGFFTLNGTASDQDINGNGNGSFHNLRIQNGAGVNLFTPIRINGNLQLTLGILYINDLLLTFGEQATTSGTFNTSNMIRLNGVNSDAGVRKLFPIGAQDFTFPIGTTLKYSPARYNVTTNTAIGNITIKPVNSKHPATTDLLNKELTYYWIVESTGFSGLNVTHTYNYHPNDAINGTEASYSTGRYFNNIWIPTNGIASTVNAASDRITLSNVNYIGGDYSAGEPSEFGIIQTYFSRNATSGGNWTDLNAWSTDVTLQHDGAPCSTPPTSHNIVIAAGHTINCQSTDNNKIAPISEINGTLNINSTSGHNLGFVSGTGTIKITPNASNQFLFPGGNFASFNNSGGGTIEFNASNAASLPTQTSYNNLTFTGNGTKSFANVNLIVNGNLSIIGGSLNNAFSKDIFLKGNWTNNIGVGGYTAGNGLINLGGFNQNLIGTTNLGKITISGGGTKTINSSMFVTTLNLNEGLVSTGNNIIHVTAQNGVSGGSSASYVFGNLKKTIPASTLTVNFEIGDQTNYAPINLNFQGTVSGSGSITANTIDGDHSAIYTSGINQDKSCNRSWNLTATGITGFTSYSARFNFVDTDIDPSANTSNFIGSQNNGTTWALVNSADVYANATQLNGLTQFGTFQLGEYLDGIIWTGATNTNWNTASNWLPQTVPTNNDNVIIGLVANQPNFTSGANGQCANITLLSGTTVTIPVTHQLSVFGNINSTGAKISGLGTFQISATSSNLKGNLIVESNMVIGAAAAFNLSPTSTVEIKRNLSIYGILNSDEAKLIFSGDQNSNLTAASSITLKDLYITKSNPEFELTLQKDIKVNGTILLVTGDINLNGNEIDLGTTGSLSGETSDNRVYGTSGTIKATRILNAPTADNVAGLGAELSAPNNLGLTQIIRGHQQKTYNAGFGLNRYYEIHPTNNSSLNATLKFNYFDDELITPSGSITEAELDLWRFDGAFWANQWATLDMVNNQLVKTGIPEFSTWTSGSLTNNALPITLISFEAKCNNGRIDLTWETASESNNKEFEIEESNDAKSWTVLAKVEGAGNSNTNITYKASTETSYPDGSYFRLKQIDYNGNFEAFDPKFVTCKVAAKNQVSIFPNPAVDNVTVTIKTEMEMNSTLTLFSSTGQILFSQKVSLTIGSNPLNLDISALPPGSYHLNISNDKKIEIEGARTIIKR
jgi:fibronectin-binding autotransporter adhesin